jgi:hypothetical protein
MPALFHGRKGLIVSDDDEKIDKDKLREACEANAEFHNIPSVDWDGLQSTDPQRRERAKRNYDLRESARRRMHLKAQDASPELREKSDAVNREVDSIRQLLSEHRATDEALEKERPILEKLGDAYDDKLFSVIKRCKPPIG